MKRLEDIRYTYNSLSVPGGGFVTGFVFHPRSSGILYARTDIGGAYRFDFASQRWVFLGNWLTEFTHHLAQPISLALDADKPERLFAMCGDAHKNFDRGRSALLVSEDLGAHFTEKPVPFHCNGNAPARSTAERLAYSKGVLWYGSQDEGLWRSCDDGDSWERLSFPEEQIAFVFAHPTEDIMIVSCTGATLSQGSDRGHTLYVSYDLEHFEPLSIPEPLDDRRCDHNGFVAGGIACDGGSVYITFSHGFKSGWGGWNDFACDNGGGFDGRLWRYDISGGRLSLAADITPDIGFADKENTRRRLPFGLGGVDVCGDVLAVCSIGGHGDGVFISRDGGSSYSVIKSTDLSRFGIDVPYLKPEYNGGRVPLHWMSCLRIDPFNADFAVINTGTGVFALKDSTRTPYISSLCYGMEETVHMNIYGVPSGRNSVIDLVGDLGGFAFSDVTMPCENSFADENGHRYITCLNADFVGSDPDTFITTARGNWTGQTKGGVILTRDGGNSFTHIGYPDGISERLDDVIDGIKKPNTNSGWAAISADGDTILWTLAYKWMQLPCFAAVRYDVKSGSFRKVRIYDFNSCDISDSEKAIKIFSDRLDPQRFYGFGEDGQLYASIDKGICFSEVEVFGLPCCRMSGIDGFKGCEIRFHPYRSGVCYAALNGHGLWRIEFVDCNAYAVRITSEGDFVKAVGFGRGEVEPALYISGTLFGEYGFWRSFDCGESWARINTDEQMFGHIVSMDGDIRRYGRVYIATGCHGGLYGDEIR